MTKFVFLDADSGMISVSVGDVTVGTAATSRELVELFKAVGLDTEQDNLYGSSSIDWASEYGFGSDLGAQELIDAALDEYSAILA